MATKATTSQAHTPGPWEIVDQSDDDDVRLELVGDSGSKPIAQIYHSFFSPLHEDMTEEEQEADEKEYAANASLIAAAPELLKIAHYLLTVCEDRLSMLKEEFAEIALPDEDLEDDFQERIRHYEFLKHDALAAIAKAEGRWR